MNFVSKTVTGALAAALLSTAVATPAEARHRGYRHNNGISLGDVVLGTIAVAGVATAVGAISSAGRYGRYDDRYDRGYGNRGYSSGRSVSVDACSYEAEREATRRFGAAARVRDVQEIDRSRYGYRVRGTVEVRDDYNDGYGRDRYYDRRGAERVAFTCSVENGRVRDLRLGSNYAYGY